MFENSTFSPLIPIMEASPMVSTIRRLWYQMFLSTLISSLAIHLIGAIVLYVRLRNHRYAKYLAMVIQFAGLTTPILICSISNALIAVILVFTDRYDMSVYFLFLIGCMQTICVIGFEFLQIVQTL